jgi:nucleoside-diphosphate-sugar epimerase
MLQHPTKPLRHVIITGAARFIGSQISARVLLDILRSSVPLERESFVRSMA